MRRGKVIDTLRKLRNQLFNPYCKYVKLLSRVVGKNVDGESCERHNDLYIITIAYNHDRLIEKQIEQVKRYVRDEGAKHVIVDNSSKKTARKRINEI